MRSIPRSPVIANVAVALLALAIWLGGSLSSVAEAAPAGTPFGSFEAAVGVAGGISVKGWTIDPSTADPIYVWVTVDGVGRHAYADKTRADVGAGLPLYGPRHGFSTVLGASPGNHDVCVTASNVGEGSHQPLGCRSVTVRTGSPFGNYERAVGGAGVVTVSGWTIDPDANGPIYVWITVDGVGRHSYAGTNRDDVGAVFPGYGSGHGFWSTISVSPGTHQVCVTASNVGAGSHRPLGCRAVTASPASQDLRATSTLAAAWASDRCETGAMVNRRVLSHSTPVNARAVDAYAALDRVLRATGYTAGWTWAYSCRVIAGTDQYSLHAYGLAVDVDPTENPHQSPTSWPVRFSSASTREGRAADVAAGQADTVFTPAQAGAVESIRTVDGLQVWAWGGRWRTLLDTMHFQINVTPEELARGLDPSTTG